MEKVSKRLASLSPSATIAMNQKSQEMKLNGIDVVNLSVGEPDFPTPDNVKAAAKKVAAKPAKKVVAKKAPVAQQVAPATKPTQSLAAAIHTAAEAKPTSAAPVAAEVKPMAPAAGSLFSQNENK